MVTEETYEARKLAERYRNNYCNACNLYHAEIEACSDEEFKQRYDKLIKKNKLPWEKK